MNLPINLKDPRYWLLGIGAGLIALHISQLGRAPNEDLKFLSLVLWLVIGSLVWEKKDSLNLDSGIFGTFFGITLIVMVLARSISVAGYQLYLLPFISLLGLCLLASGFKGLIQYYKELIIIGLLTVHPFFVSILKAIDLPTLTAKFGAFILNLIGFQAVREGVFISLPTGAVEVYEACSGIESIIQMFNISVIFLFLVPTNTIQKILCILMGITLGFVVNGGRVVLLALLVAWQNKEGFVFWHDGSGSWTFSMISTGLFMLFAWFAFLRDQEIDPDSGELE